MISSLKETLIQSAPFQRLEEILLNSRNSFRLSTSGISGSLMAFVADVLSGHFPRVLILVADKDRAEQLRDDCVQVSPHRRVHVYAHARHHTGTSMDASGVITQLEALQSLVRSEETIVVASAEAAVSLLPAPEFLKDRSLILTVGTEHPFEGLLSILETWGFERKEFVESYGEVAVRGGILDVFPFVGEHPLRVEFWGDAIESIRQFDPLSQRSIRELQSATLAASLESLDGKIDRRATILEYAGSGTILLVDESALCEREVEELFREGIQGIIPWSAVLQKAANIPIVYHSGLQKTDKNDISFGASPQPSFQGSIRLLLEHLTAEPARNCTQVLTCDTPDEKERIKELLEDEVLRRELPSEQGWKVPQIISEALHNGFLYPPASLLLYTEHQIFGRLKRRGVHKRPRFRGFSQREVQRLTRGDFVVHADYGVGTFAGLQTITVRGNEQEVMKILYEDADALYVNLNFINRVQKYSSQEGHKPALTKLGTPQWDRVKARARKRIKDIARELIRLYAERKHKPGFSFSADSHWQKEMEASFMYEDTPDQLKATEAVKADMQDPVPMDRLICGDVGFGKTEVAVRAAFKAALDGKQTAVLVPTTILAHQHYQTFLSRLGKYSVRVESLSRFKSKKEQQVILQGIKEGTIDILIGTHRLLSKDISFKDLGLLVVDEEHRFGVSAKEKLRQLKASVDTLMLTATPIPRTLQFSLMGARDLSLINTPPRNRLPIITEIAEFDHALIREAILKELHRGGQVYFIHDRIQSMESVVSLLQAKVPEARFHSAHGRMKGHELEKTMLAFLDRKYDVLVCTKIIESGIDIPQVNTIIINRADRFGLAELYQLRGRVGRSNVQAYAYLLTPPLSSLPRVSLQRLQSVQEFTELGSGFNLALRDMEIRGAGNLLGAEQSGFIMEMGFEMYQRVVEEAVQELKDQEFEGLFEKEAQSRKDEQRESIIETDFEALIPDLYVESDRERLDIYRRLYQAQTLGAVASIREELSDRFGDAPEEVDFLLLQVEIKTMALQLRIPKVELSGVHLVLFLPSPGDTAFYGKGEGERAMFQSVMEELALSKDVRFSLQQDGPQLKLRVMLKGPEGSPQRLKQVSDLFTRFLEAARAIPEVEQ